LTLPKPTEQYAETEAATVFIILFSECAIVVAAGRVNDPPLQMDLCEWIQKRRPDWAALWRYVLLFFLRCSPFRLNRRAVVMFTVKVTSKAAAASAMAQSSACHTMSVTSI